MLNHLGSTPGCEFGLTVDVHAVLVFGLVLLSQPHLPKSSLHEQRSETSQLGTAELPTRQSLFVVWMV